MATKKTKLENAYKTPSNVAKLDAYNNIVNQHTSAQASLNAANAQAMKYADTALKAQGLATQGAYQQSMGALQNAYLNQTGQQNLLAQQQIGTLSDTTSADALNRMASDISNLSDVSSANIDRIKNAYYGRLSGLDKSQADNLLSEAYKVAQETALTKKEEEEAKVLESYAVDYGIDPENGISVNSIMSSEGSARKVLGSGTGGKGNFEELQRLISLNRLKEGSVVQIKNKKFVYINGNLYKTLPTKKASFVIEYGEGNF